MRQEMLYSHSQSGRRPQAFVAPLLCVGMAGFGLWNGLPWFLLPIMFGACLGASWPLIANPQSGAVLTRETLRFFHGKKDQIIRLTDIASVKRRSYSESSDDVTLTLRSGQKVYVPSQSVDRRLDAALQKVGIFVRS